MMTYDEQLALLRKAYELDFENVVYPTVTGKEYEYINPFDITDILTVIKDLDIARYNKMDTLASDYCIEICQKLVG